MGAPTTIADPGIEGGQPPEGGLAVLVMSAESVAAFPLPGPGEITLGRSEECEVLIDDPLASRRHARLRREPTLQIEDLGSSNGTRLRGQPIPSGSWTPLGLGEAVTIGSTVLVVQPAPAAHGARRLWCHRWFERRAQEECELRRGLQGRFVLGRLALPSPLPWWRVVPLVDRHLPAPHLFAAYGPYDYELLLLDTDAEEAAAMVEAIRGALAAIGGQPRVGLATFPRDGCTAEALMEHANQQLRPRVQTLPPSPGGTAMQAVNDVARRAARSNINVLIMGETGVGKEVMAQAIHRQSPRAGAPMLALNCAGLSESLIESELFGHERGAFTGAVQAKEGLFEAASGGTLFLDEVGEMPPTMQARLLRAIANREILRVGSTKPRRVDVRVVAATNRNLEAEVTAGSFREDLYYRLNGITVVIPPLRERREEIEPLARAFLAEAAQASCRQPPALSPAAAAWLLHYDWPGNIRELRNVVERALVLCEGDVLLPAHLPTERARPAVAAPAAVGTSPAGRSPAPDEREERQRIVDALEANVWNQSRAAQALGMSRRTLVSKLDRYGIPRPQKSGP
jgi:two-component system response regulator AtoC